VPKENDVAVHRRPTRRARALALALAVVTIGAGSGAAGARPAPAADELEAATHGEVVRLAGDSRFETAVAISRDLFPAGGAAAAVLVSGGGFADALPGTVLARAARGPLLLTHAEVLPGPTRAELDRVLGGSGTVWIVGGTGVIGEAVVGSLAEAGYRVRRLGGASRFETAVRVAEVIPGPAGVVVADGGSFTDGLVAAAAAASTGGVLLLSAGDRLDGATVTALERFADLPRTAVGASAAAAVPDATAFVGLTAGHTSRLVAEHLHPDAAVVGVASDQDYPDGLAGGLHSAVRGGPLLLTGPDDLDVPVLGHLDHLDVAGHLAAGYVYGGEAAIGAAVVDQVAEEVAGGTRTILSAAPRLCLDRSGASAPQILERPCEVDHEYEVFATLAHPDASPEHPGAEALESYAAEVCTGQPFTDYIGVEYERSRWFVSTSVPTPDGWAEGDRGIVCLVYDVRGPVTDSAYGSAQ
jgi:hypothetical protein